MKPKPQTYEEAVIAAKVAFAELLKSIAKDSSREIWGKPAIIWFMLWALLLFTVLTVFKGIEVFK